MTIQIQQRLIGKKCVFEYAVFIPYGLGEACYCHPSVGCRGEDALYIDPFLHLLRVSVMETVNISPFETVVSNAYL